MSKEKTKTPEELHELNKHISTETIEQDITDTKMEISQYRREKAGYELIGDKMSMFKADNRQIRITERQEFVEKLQTILEYRKQL